MKSESQREYQKRWRQQNPDKVKAKQERWEQRHPGASTQKAQRYRSNHPDRIREASRNARQKYPGRIQAYKAVAHALETGRLVKPLTCEICQKEKRLQAHHEDYAKPLDVKWICSSCHKLIHLARPAGEDAGIVAFDRKPQGESHHSAKLTEYDVKSIRTRFDAGGISKAALAREYGVTDVLIGLIVRREAWKHVA